MSDEGLPLELQNAAFLLCPHMAFLRYVHVGKARSSQVILLIRTLILLGQDPALIASFNLKYVLIGPLSKYSHPGS